MAAFLLGLSLGTAVGFALFLWIAMRNPDDVEDYDA